MQFTLLISSAPHDPATRRALLFARALLAAGHSIGRIFFYQDAVQIASQLVVCPQDETDWAAAWQQLVQEQQLDAVVCIAAALRRGVLDAAEAKRYGKEANNLAAGFVLAGLGDLHEALQRHERLVHFRGDA